MKFLFGSIILMIAGVSVFGNSIDELQTAQDVNLFLQKAFPKYGGALLDENAAVTSDYGKNKFYKLDLDGNGLTDLLVDGCELAAVLNTDGENYTYHDLDIGSSDVYGSTVVNITRQVDVPILVLRGFNSESKVTLAKETEKNVLFKFGEFIEYNPEPDKFRIQKIAFETTGCLGTCPVLEIKIDERRRATYNAIHFNERNGKFRGMIDPPVFNKLVDTINYIGLKKLKDEYAVGHTDAQGATLTITYDNGQVRKIEDYGMVGCFGLANLYNQLFDLRNTQKWRRIS
jgi:hypothetical protein